MKREFFEKLTPDQIERCLFAYREICDVYEEVCGGPRGAYVWREYATAIDTRRKCYTRLQELTREHHGNGVQD